MNTVRFSPLAFGLLSYAIGIIPFALLDLKVIPSEATIPVMIGLILFSGVGQIITGLIKAKLMMQPSATLFLIYGFHWTFIGVINWYAATGGFVPFGVKSPAYVILSLIVGTMTLKTVKGPWTMSLLYALAFFSLVFKSASLLIPGMGSEIAAYFFLTSAGTSLYIAISELLRMSGFSSSLPLGDSVQNASSKDRAIEDLSSSIPAKD